MYKLSEEIKKRLSESIGIPYEKLITMDDDEITAYIEQKNGKKMGWSKPDSRFSGSGDDSVLIDQGKIRTIEDVDKMIDSLEIIYNTIGYSKDIIVQLFSKIYEICDGVKKNKVTLFVENNPQSLS